MTAECTRLAVCGPFSTKSASTGARRLFFTCRACCFVVVLGCGLVVYGQGGVCRMCMWMGVMGGHSHLPLRTRIYIYIHHERTQTQRTKWRL